MKRFTSLSLGGATLAAVALILAIVPLLAPPFWFSGQQVPEVVPRVAPDLLCPQ